MDSDGAMSVIKLGRGVTICDPLSLSLLFNLVVDRTLEILLGDIGYRMGANVINALGYADDIILFSFIKIGLQEKLTRHHTAFMKNGLNINANKTDALFVVTSVRDKKVKIDTTSSFALGGMVIPRRSPTDIWTYLECAYQGAREYANNPRIRPSSC